MPNLKKEIGVVVNDLGVYHRGLEVAVGKNQIKDVIRYLNNMKDEVAYALATIQPLGQKVGETEVVRQGIEKDLADHRSKMQELQKKLKKLKQQPILDDPIEDGSGAKL